MSHPEARPASWTPRGALPIILLEKNTDCGILVMKGNAFESVLVRWMKLEPVIQGEVSQRKTNVV